MKRLIGVEITQDMPRLSTGTAIERQADDVRVIWQHWNVGRLVAPSYHGTPNVIDLGDFDAEAQ